MSEYSDMMAGYRDPADKSSRDYCVCGAPVKVAPCDECGKPLRVDGRVYGVCARPACDTHVSRNQVTFAPHGLVGTLDRIAAVMRLREPDDFLLSEIQDYLTMAGYDVPLRSYRDTRRDAP